MALWYSADSLVLLAGIPGAGKSTLLRRVFQPDSGVRVLDSERLRERWRPVLGPVPYGLWRPLLHAVHYLHVLTAMRRGGPIVVHDCATRPWVRRMLGRRARRFGLQVHLVLLDVSEEQARAGQLARGRVVRPGSFATHCRRWRSLVAAARECPGRMVPGARSAIILDRPAADRLTGIRFGQRVRPPLLLP
jgi:predicted kinase